MSQFYISETRSNSSLSSASASDDDALSTLPFAQPLPRAAFLTPDFTPSTYLTTLSHRHQTLEDLRAELRARSQLLSRELLDLVNANYADFLTLGRSLSGGEERVEGVRVGLLGFEKEVAQLREVVGAREREVDGLIGQRREARGAIQLGQRLLGVEERVRACEVAVGVVGARESESSGSESESGDEDEDEDEGATFGTGVARLRRNVLLYRMIGDGVSGLEEHPFVAAQAARVAKVRAALLLDLGSALQQAKRAGTVGAGRVMQILGLYADMEEQGEAVKVLKALKR